jgi:hypothetical protein
MLDRALKQILSLMYLYLLLVAYLIHLLLAAIHHFRIGQSPGLFYRVGVSQD